METNLNISTMTYAASDVMHRWIKAKPELCVIMHKAAEDALKQLEIVKEITLKKISSVHFDDVTGTFKLFWARARNKDIFIFSGRHYYYEGKGWEQVVLPVFIGNYCGANKLLLLGVAGGITIEPLSTILVKDHINLMGTTPLVGEHNPEFGPRFPTMTNVYDTELRTKIKKLYQQYNEKITEGVLAGLQGPCFETEAEIKMIKMWGADAVATHTVPEAIFAKALGLKTAALNIIINNAAGIGSEPLSINEIVENTDIFTKKGGYSIIPHVIESILD